MSASGTRRDDAVVDDELIAKTEQESSAVRNLFDLRVIIGALFTLYGVFLTIYGLMDSPAEVAKAAGVRINLWTGLGMLALGLGFLLWAKLRPLTIDAVVEGQAAEVEEDRELGGLSTGSRPTGGH